MATTNSNTPPASFTEDIKCKPAMNNPTSLNISSDDLSELTRAIKEFKWSMSTLHVTALNCDWTCSNSAVSSSIPTGDWGLHKTGAFHHIFNNSTLFENGTLTKNPDPSRRLTLAGGKDSLSIHSIGIVELFDVQKNKVQLHTALYVPSLNKKLIAGGALLKKGVQTIVDQSNKDIFTIKIGDCNLFNGFFKGNLMILKLDRFKVSPLIKHMDCNSATDTLLTIHKQLGHANRQYLLRMLEHYSVRGMENIKKDTSFECIPCMKGKAERLPFSRTRPRANEFIQNVHMDLSGIVCQGSLEDTLYYILFTNDFSGMKFLYKLN